MISITIVLSGGLNSNALHFFKKSECLIDLDCFFTAYQRFLDYVMPNSVVLINNISVVLPFYKMLPKISIILECIQVKKNVDIDSFCSRVTKH